jgi:hypothetical protein
MRTFRVCSGPLALVFPLSDDHVPTKSQWENCMSVRSREQIHEQLLSNYRVKQIELAIQSPCIHVQQVVNTCEV